MDDLTPSEVTAFLIEGEGPPVLLVRGELDVSSAEQIRPVIEKVLQRHDQHVVVDVSGLTFMDSTGIAVLLTLAHGVDHLQLRDPSPMVRQIVEMTGLSEILRLEP